MTNGQPKLRNAVGRPRLGPPLRPDMSPRDQILDAAARLFVEQGYAATSTRAIADEVGIRQASLYYHFATKERMLDALLLRTVEPSLSMATSLVGSAGSASARLAALIVFDVGELLRSPHNVGTLYFLPEVRGGRFERFREQRLRLREVYSTLIAAAIRDDGGARPAGASGEYLTDVVFALVESVISQRTDLADLDPEPLVGAITDSCFRVLGLSTSAAAFAATAAELLAALSADRRAG